MTYSIKVQRNAEATLEVIVEVEANSREEAENKALHQSEKVLAASDFTVASIDLLSQEGSSEVIE